MECHLTEMAGAGVLSYVKVLPLPLKISWFSAVQGKLDKAYRKWRAQAYFVYVKVVIEEQRSITPPSTADGCDKVVIKRLHYLHLYYITLGECAHSRGNEHLAVYVGGILT